MEKEADSLVEKLQEEGTYVSQKHATSHYMQLEEEIRLRVVGMTFLTRRGSKVVKQEVDGFLQEEVGNNVHVCVIAKIYPFIY